MARRLGIDSSSNLLVADALNHVIRKVTPTGVVTTMGSGGSDLRSAVRRLEATDGSHSKAKPYLRARSKAPTSGDLAPLWDGPALGLSSPLWDPSGKSDHGGFDAMDRRK